MVAGEMGGVHGDGGDDGFAAADVALEEAVHGFGFGGVLENFVYGLALGGGEGEG